MISFQVNDMTCGHCVTTIANALKSEDATANVSFDLPTHRVDIEPGKADAAKLTETIKNAGYSPVRIAGEGRTHSSGAGPTRNGCCCG